MSIRLNDLAPNTSHDKGSFRQRLIRLLALSVISCLLLMADDFIQKIFTDNNQAELELEFVFVVWLFSLSLWLVAMPRLVTGILILLASMQLMQLSHVSFFGEPLSAPDITSFFVDFAEVRETTLHSFSDHWHVLPSVLLPYSLLIYLHIAIPSKVDIPRSRWALIIIILVLGSKPYRATYRDLTSFMPGPTRSGLHNSFNAFAYYGVRLAFRPAETLPPAPFAPYKTLPKTTHAQHVWLVVADSLRTDRLGVMGYARNTTPNLSRLADQGELIARPGIAAGVSTAVSLPNLLNVIREPGQTDLLRSQPHNLFALARQSGFKTHWISSQESKLLSHLGSNHLDVSITREDHPLLFLKRHDHALVDLLAKQEWGARNFVTLNLRTAHLPYEENYDQHTEALNTWPTDSDLPREQRKANAYDNAVSYLDDVLAEIITQFDQLEGERYLIITGDHGQLLGENGRWGHNDLVPQVAEVPILVIAREADEKSLEGLTTQHWVSHYEAAVWIAERLGWEIQNPNKLAGEHFIQGKQLFGDNMIKRVLETPDGLNYEEPVLVSRWLKKLNETSQ